MSQCKREQLNIRPLKNLSFVTELRLVISTFCSSQIRWTKTAGSVSDRFQDSSVFNETLHIAKILRTQGGRYYCKAENGLGSPAIKSIRVDVYCKYPDLPGHSNTLRTAVSLFWVGFRFPPYVVTRLLLFQAE